VYNSVKNIVCKERAMSAKVCVQCGCPLDAKSNFCPKCGAKVNALASSNSKIPPSNADKNTSSAPKVMKIVGMIAAGIGVFVVLLLALVFYLTSGLTGIVHKQLNALHHDDIAKAYSYTSKDFQSVTTIEDFQTFVEQFPSLKDNKSATFTEREIKNNVGVLKGTLTSKDGIENAVEYQLIKEDGKWRILGISMRPAGAKVEIKRSEESNANNSSASEHVYEDQNNRYSIKYPANWIYETSGNGVVIFSGPKNTPAYFSTVNIQTILSKKAGGKYTNLKEMISSLKKQMNVDPSTKIISEGDAALPQDPKRTQGHFLIFTYNYKGQQFKQMQYVIFREDGEAFYAWAYTSPIDRYDVDFAVAKAMYDSWVIH
jgi:hypothetical protein